MKVETITITITCKKHNIKLQQQPLQIAKASCDADFVTRQAMAAAAHSAVETRQKWFLQRIPCSPSRNHPYPKGKHVSRRGSLVVHSIFRLSSGSSLGPSQDSPMMTMRTTKHISAAASMEWQKGSGLGRFGRHARQLDPSFGGDWRRSENWGFG